MCDAPTYHPICMFCNRSLYNTHEKWYWVSELPKDDTGGSWNAVCGKCWLERKEEVKEKKKEWESYHTQRRYSGCGGSGKVIHLWKGKEVSFGMYMKRKYDNNTYTKGIEKWM